MCVCNTREVHKVEVWARVRRAVRMEVGLRGRRSKAEQDLLRLVRLRLDLFERGGTTRGDNEPVR